MRVPAQQTPRASPERAEQGLSALAAGAIVVGIVTLTGLLGRRNAPEPSHPRIDRWYHGLNKPPFTPPDPVFGAVWPTVKVALACGGYRLLRTAASPARNAAVALWLLNTGMIGGWTELFFRRNRLGPSAAAAAGMFAAGIGYVAVARRVDRRSAAAGLPYVGWLGFAMVLAEEVWRLNDAAHEHGRLAGKP